MKDYFTLINSKTKHILFVASFPFFFVSCGGARYDYYFEKGKSLDFKHGKWILNKPMADFDYPRKVGDFAHREFSEIIPDSLLLEIFDLRRAHLVGKTIPIDPTIKDLEKLGDFSGCDYLINIKSEVLRDDMGSFVGSSTVRNEQTNKAVTYITIYDLHTLQPISISHAVGTVKVTEDKDTGGLLDFVSSGVLLAVHSMVKLIRRYKRYQVK